MKCRSGNSAPATPTLHDYRALTVAFATGFTGGRTADAGRVFLEKCRETMRHKHFSYRTEQTYLPVIESYIVFRGGRPRPSSL